MLLRLQREQRGVVISTACLEENTKKMLNKKTRETERAGVAVSTVAAADLSRFVYEEGNL